MKYKFGVEMYDLGFCKVASVSPEFKIADIDFNLKEIKKLAQQLNDNLVEIAVFPELCITGYTCGDLFFQKLLLKQAELAFVDFCEFSENFKTIFILGAPLVNSGKLFNCAVVISQGEIIGVVPKTYICNYNEYYEERWFSSDFDRTNNLITIGTYSVPFGADLIFESIYDENLSFGVEICEDLWAVKPPSNDLAVMGATIIFNLSAGNELLGKNIYRNELVKFQSAKLISAYVYAGANANESSTDTTFSGHLMIYENGRQLSQFREFSFESQIITAYVDIQLLTNDRIKNNTFSISKSEKQYRRVLADFSYYNGENIERNYSQHPFVPADLNERTSNCEEISKIQVTGLSKRLLHIGTQITVIGVSGGLDSTLALLSIVKTYQKLNFPLENIIAVTMPGFGTTNRTKSNATKLIELLKTSFREINISNAVKQHFEDINHNPENFDIVFENSQARERTQILMDIANQVNGIVVGTGDMSEYALGWCTYNGDQMSMYGINSGIPKTLIKYLIEWYANDVFDGEISEILKDIINTPISPELLPPDKDGNIAQDTEKSVGPYLINDFILYYFLRYNFTPLKIFVLIKKAFGDLFEDEEIKSYLRGFFKRFFVSQYKRSSMPDGVKVGTVSLSQRADWRMPSDAEYNLWLNEIDKL